MSDSVEGRARAVQFDRFGDTDVLYIADLPIPEPGEGEVLIEVRAAGINPGESAIRRGELNDFAPTTFPSGQGSDLAGVVLAVADSVKDIAVGDEVLGYSSTRSSHATHAVVPATQLIKKPEQLSWEQAGAIYVVGVTSFAAVRAINPAAGETVAVSAAAGGVGDLVTQILILQGVTVLGIASEANADWLSARGAIPVPYGTDLASRLRAAAQNGIDAFIDLHGPEYLDLAVELGITPSRIETIIAFPKADEIGAHHKGSVDASDRPTLTKIADQVATGALELTIADTYPLDEVKAAFDQLDQRHTRGKIVLLPTA